MSMSEHPSISAERKKVRRKKQNKTKQNNRRQTGPMPSLLNRLPGRRGGREQRRRAERAYDDDARRADRCLGGRLDAVLLDAARLGAAVRGAVLGRLALDVVDVHHLLVLVVGLLDRAHDDPRDRERDEDHDPRREMLVEEGRRDGVHAARARGTGGLESVVETGVASEGEGVVRERGHDPVRERLVARVGEVVCMRAYTQSACAGSIRGERGTHRRSRARPCPCSWSRGS